MSRAAPLRARAHAKVNLTLEVVPGRRPDGYHDLRGVFARLALGDDVAVRPGDRGARGDALPSVRGEGAGDDLALRAVDSLRSWAARPLPPLRVSVRKRTPVAAGLAGGSSDAAAALRLAAAAWGLSVADEALGELALGLGSDVPFFLGPSHLALVEGRGERVLPLPAEGVAGTGVLLVCAQGKPSTARVFAAFEGHPGTGSAGARGRRPPDRSVAREATDRLVALLAAGARPGDLVALASAMRDANALYPAAVVVTPGLERLREAVETALGRPVMLSGAGPTLFALYASRAEASTAARWLRPRLAAGGGLAPAARVIVTAIAGKEEA